MDKYDKWGLALVLSFIMVVTIASIFEYGLASGIIIGVVGAGLGIPLGFILAKIIFG